MPVFGGGGVGISMKGAPTNSLSILPGQVFYPNSYPNPTVPGQGVGSGGWFMAKLGRYTVAQIKDPITGIWRGIGDDSNAMRYIYGDGVNMRFANQSGCAVGAVVTTAGSAYTTAPTVVASEGSSVWQSVLGPYVTSATVNFGGTNYTYPPIVVIDAPPAGGVPASGTATLTGTTVSAITIVNQGAGYGNAIPVIRLVTDPRDTTGSGAQATAVMAGSGTVAAVLCIDHGNPITSGTVPTLTFGSGSAAATALMNWGITTYAVGTPGGGYGTSLNITLTAAGPAAPTATRTNPASEYSLVRQRPAVIWVPTNASGALQTGGIILDGGVYVGVATPQLVAAGAPSTLGVITLSMGGLVDVVDLVQPW